MLRRSFCVLVLAFALFHLSENTADPDLWGHVLFGERMILRGQLDRVDPFSWPAHGRPWINHEWFAEVAMGGAHLLCGGTGLLLLKVGVGLAAFGIALAAGARGLSWPWRGVAWGIAFVAVAEVGFGCAVRPQIFTALALAVEFRLLQRVHDGEHRQALWLPLLFAAWVNTHGGVLAGWLLWNVATLASLMQALVARRRGMGAVRPATAGWLAAAGGAASLALLANPWGATLPRWLVESVSWGRPEIQEWRPTSLGWDHAPFLVLLAVSLPAAARECRRGQWWPAAVLSVLAIMALRHVRHAPLFALGALALAPQTLAGWVRDRAPAWAGFRRVLQARGKAAAAGLLVLSAATLTAALTLRKQHPLTIEVPRRQYPLEAIRFMKQAGIRGNLLVFFDWGELCLWELPGVRPSIDGRLDTCYPREVVRANWAFYNGDPVDSRVLDLRQAEAALVPRSLAGPPVLVNERGWECAYLDPLAVVLVRDPSRYPGLLRFRLPKVGDDSIVRSSAAFPDGVPASVWR